MSAATRATRPRSSPARTTRGTLVAGGRRLAACKLLGLHHVEVRRFGELSPAERRVIELEENLHRKDLTAFERSKATVETVEAAKFVAKAEAAAASSKKEAMRALSFVIPDDATHEEASRIAKAHAEWKRANGNPRERPEGSRGPLPDPASRKSAAARVGVDERTVRDAEAHVTIAERYPLLQAPDWTQRAAVKVGKLLDAMPAKERKRIVGMCEQQRAHAACVIRSGRLDTAGRPVETWSP